MAAGPETKKPNTILTPDSRLRVFISSALKELAEERETVRKSILKLRLLPVMFEAGARPHPARELYQAYLAQSHIFVGIYWQSYGWVGPGMEISGLEDELNLSSHLPRLIYIKSPAAQRDAGLERMLARLQQENAISYKRFSTSAELGELVENDLALLLSEKYESASRSPEAEFTPGPLTNIPFPRNPLLGRAQELQTICNWLTRDDTGMVTLTGPGGTGKSRLALEAALQLREQFADGVYLVRLSPVTDPERVTATIAETLGLRESAQGRPLEEILTNYLRGRCVLLVLDNFEQILAAAPKIANLLEACPRLKLLVTSRAPLRLRSEKELFIPPLAIPDPKTIPDGQHLSQYASVALFIQRAQGVRPDFKVTNENAPAVAEICTRLDGLPLAIELAAARIKLLAPQELLARLSNNFDILRGGMRDLPERQQTLRGAIDWSYNLLTEPARAIFRRLSVFAGGFSIEAAEAVCNLNGNAGPSVLEEIEELIDFSLLTPVDGLEGRQRFGMLQTIREYAAERLAESDEAERVRRLHAEYFLRFAQEVEPRVRSAERARWRAVLEQELDNIRGAVRWAAHNAEGVELGQRLTIALTFFWALCGFMSEGRRYGEEFVALIDEKTPLAIRAALLSLSGTLVMLQGDTKPDMATSIESVKYAREAGDARVLGTALLLSGAHALASNDILLAAQTLEECQPLLHDLGDEWMEQLALLWLSNTVSLQGEAERAAELFQRCLALARHQGDPWLLLAPMIDIAQAAFANGDLDTALARLLEVESMLRTVGDQWGLGWPLSALGQIQLARGNIDAARDYIIEALELGREYGNMMAEIFALVEAAALLALRHGHPGADPDQRNAGLMNAARLCGATQPMLGLPIMLGSTQSRDVYHAMIAQVRSSMDAESWERGYREGEAMPLEEALDLAASELRRDTH